MTQSHLPEISPDSPLMKTIRFICLTWLCATVGLRAAELTGQ